MAAQISEPLTLAHAGISGSSVFGTTVAIMGLREKEPFTMLLAIHALLAVGFVCVFASTMLAIRPLRSANPYR